MTRASNPRSRKQTITIIPDRARTVGAVLRTTTAADGTTRQHKVPSIVLEGEWLADLGFTVDAPIYLVAEDVGDLIVQRMCLRRPRRFRIVSRA